MSAHTTTLATLALFAASIHASTASAAPTKPFFTPAALTSEAARQPIEPSRILPAPREIVQGAGSWTPIFIAGKYLKSDDALKSEGPALECMLRELRLLSTAQVQGANPATVEFRKADIAEAPANVRDQAYRLRIAEGSIVIEAQAPAGAFHAIQTLRQLLPSGGGKVANVTITDWPALRLRGHMHDTGRNFQEVDLLKKQIEIWSRYKLNAFHFHFTDNPGWRLESKLYPELQSDKSFTRKPGKFYTQEEFRDLVKFCVQRHITLIPELDVPGHSLAFQRTYGLKKMDSPGVRERMANLIDELCRLAPASVMPYIHLGTDEVKEHEHVPNDWIEGWVAVARKHGRQVIGWNHGIRTRSGEGMVQQLWAGHSRPWPDRPYIDSQNSFYINHVDPFEMLPAFAYQQPCRWGSEDSKLGAIVCTWHDDNARSGEDVVLMNAVHPGTLLFSDNAWRGREKNEGDHWTRLPARNDPRFALAKDLEDRLLAQRDRYFAAEPFPYVRQTDIEWRLIGPFDNKGNRNAAFAPETEGVKPSYEVDGKTWTWWADPVVGATTYPYHFWFPSHLKQNKGTVYAFTRIWSPADQEVGAWIGFNAWSRSAGRKRGGGTPAQGQWSRDGDKIWVNGAELPGPKWAQPNVSDEETPLVDDDYFYRPASRIQLRKGWNTVLVKAPQVNSWKWVFTFIPVRETGRGFNVTEVPGLRYSAGFEGSDAKAFADALAKAGQVPTSGAGDTTRRQVCDFDDAKAGPFTELQTSMGTWRAAKGQAAIEPGKGSKRSPALRINGGDNCTVTLNLPDVERIEALSFRLQRWTANPPFELVVEILEDARWTPVKTFAKDHPTSAAMQRIPLGGRQSNAIRLRVSAPASTGILLDDFGIE